MFDTPENVGFLYVHKDLKDDLFKNYTKFYVSQCEELPYEFYEAIIKFFKIYYSTEEKVMYDQLVLEGADMGWGAWSMNYPAHCKIIASAEFKQQEFVDEKKNLSYDFNEDTLFKLNFKLLTEMKQLSFKEGLFICLKVDQVHQMLNKQMDKVVRDMVIFEINAGTVKFRIKELPYKNYFRTVPNSNPTVGMFGQVYNQQVYDPPKYKTIDYMNDLVLDTLNHLGKDSLFD